MGIEDDLCAMSGDRRGSGVEVGVKEVARPRDWCTWHEVLKDLDENHLARRGGNLRHRVGCGTQTAAAVVVSGVLVRVCNRDRPT